VSILKNIEKQRVEVFALLPDSEMVWTQGLIAQILHDAGWDARINANRRIAAGLFVNGIAVEVQAGAEPRVRESALLLAKALSDAGLQSGEPVSSYIPFVSDSRIEILVGNKPW
jgi:hypothetical protein